MVTTAPRKKNNSIYLEQKYVNETFIALEISFFFPCAPAGIQNKIQTLLTKEKKKAE